MTVIHIEKFEAKEQAAASGNRKIIDGYYEMRIDSFLNNESIQISFEDFERIYKDSRTTRNLREYIPLETSIAEEPRILSDISRFEDKNVVANLKSLFSDKRITFSEIVNDQTLNIIADNDQWLHLPWEEIILPATSKKLRIKRLLQRGNNKQSNSTDILMLFSYSHEGGDIVSENFPDEVKDIFCSIDQEGKGQSNIEIIKHLKRQRLEDIIWNNYAYIHISMHADFDKGLSIEHQNNPDTPEYIEFNRFAALVKKNRKHFSLIDLCFLACCDGAVGDYNIASLAYQLCENECTRYCIAFRGKIGNESIKSFIREFYIKLFKDKSNIEDSFYESLFKWRDEIGNYVNIPVLYHLV